MVFLASFQLVTKLEGLGFLGTTMDGFSGAWVCFFAPTTLDSLTWPKFEVAGLLVSPVFGFWDRFFGLMSNGFRMAVTGFGEITGFGCCLVAAAAAVAGFGFRGLLLLSDI